MLSIINSGAAVRCGLAAVLILAVASCSEDDSPRIATAQTQATSAAGITTSAPAVATDLASYLKAQRGWVDCLRKQGLNVTDPDDKGQVKFPELTPAQKSDPAFADAQQACKSLSVSVPESVERLRSPKLTAAQKKISQQYASCMQRNGAPDFPDPDADGGLARKTWDQTSAGAAKASRACASIIGDPDVVGPGRG